MNLALTSLLIIGSAPANAKVDAIRVHDASSGCGYSNVRDYEWRGDLGGFRRGDVLRTQQEVDTLRVSVLASKDKSVDVLAQIGFTPAQLVARREEILAAAWPPSLDDGEPRDVPGSVEALLSYEKLAPLVLAELVGPRHGTEQRELRVVLPGTPVITIESDSLSPWKLPWHVSVGAEQWDCADVSMTRSLARFVDADGPNGELVDGTRYWTDEFWHDRRFWRWSALYRELDSALAARRYTPLDGYAQAMERFTIDRVSSGQMNLLPDALVFELTPRSASPLDHARWWNTLVDKRPVSTWNDFVTVFDCARECVAAHAWLAAWKAAGPNRTLSLDAMGKYGFPGGVRRSNVVPPWRDAGFQGEPEFQVLLCRGRDWCGTVWLSRQEPGTLVEMASGGTTEHWFDRLEVAFHPAAPTYGRIDANGKCEVRTVGR